MAAASRSHGSHTSTPAYVPPAVIDFRLAGPAVREMIAGVSTADQRHGGDGALYVALKRKA